MSKINTYITVNEDKWQDALPEYEQTCHKISKMCIEACTDDIASYENAEVSILLTNDKQIQELNRAYRDKDNPTNVLSFAALDEDDDIITNADDPIILGDIIASLETIRREAEEQNKSLEHHFCHMIVHGMLHLLGHDHMDDNEAKEMESLEIEILKEFEIENPY